MINYKYFRFDFREIHHLYYGLGLMWLSQVLAPIWCGSLSIALVTLFYYVYASNPVNVDNDLSRESVIYLLVVMFIGFFTDRGLFFLGAAIALDDLVQHIKQGYGLYGYSYQSWAASQFNWIYGTKWWKELVSKFKWLKND